MVLSLPAAASTFCHGYCVAILTMTADFCGCIVLLMFLCVAVIGFMCSLDKNEDIHSLPNIFCLNFVRMIPVLISGSAGNLAVICRMKYPK